jgi:hypothetical protein
VLLGDSIFDNARYVPGGSPIVEQLRSRLPRGWRATLLAVDGSVVNDVVGQTARLPADASHLVVSAGGNDALENSGIVEEAAISAAEGFSRLAAVRERFRQNYQHMLQSVLAAGKPTAVCTVYDSIPGLVPEAVTALSVFNDVILREAFRVRLPVLDLRLICDEVRDYSTHSPIEPSQHGGLKIVLGIARLVMAHDFRRGESVVHGK